MHNENIKEILEKLKDGIGKFEEYDNNALLESDECEILLDYITNLQQENNNLKTSLDESQEVVIDLQQENERLKELDENYPIEEELAEAYRREEDYKSRIEKAVEYIKQEEIEIIYKELGLQWCNAKDNLLDILNGSDE